MTVGNAQALQTLDAAARSLGVSARTIRRYIATGALTGYRLGPRLLRVDSAEVVGLARPIPTVVGRIPVSTS